MNIYQFMDLHPVLTWCLAWPAFFIAYLVIVVAFKVINRTLRTIKVLARGWPPVHLDVDGDFKPQPEVEP